MLLLTKLCLVWHSIAAIHHLETGSSLQYLMLTSPNGHVWHKDFFRWVRAQGWSPHMPGISKNAYSLIGIPLIRGTSGTGQMCHILRGWINIQIHSIMKKREKNILQNKYFSTFKSLIFFFF